MTDHPWTRRARFVPKRTDNLRPGLADFSGRVFNFDYAGTSDDDEAYPGQHRWTFSREHDAELGPELAGLWAPDEDLHEL